MMHEEFISAIHGTKLVELTFNSKGSSVITRKCAPMDFGPFRRSSSPEPKYHFYNIDSNHPMPLTADQILTMKILSAEFDPKAIVHWTPNWHIERNWGIYS